MLSRNFGKNLVATNILPRSVFLNTRNIRCLPDKQPLLNQFLELNGAVGVIAQEKMIMGRRNLSKAE